MEVATKITHTFSAPVKWNEELHTGTVQSGKLLPITFGSPPEFGGTDDVWSPEHLLVASVSSCYATTFFFFVKLLKLRVRAFSMKANMEIEKDGAGPFTATHFILHPHIEFEGTPAPAMIDNLLTKAKKYCIISNSVKGEVTVEPEFSTE